MKIAVVALTVKGREIAKKIKASIKDIEVYLSSKYADGCEDTAFSKPLGELIGEIFNSYDGIICIMASGIVVRAVAPYLTHKSTDPGIVVVDDGGKFAISLVAGHLGGANALAREIAQALGGQAVITTASDNMGVISAEMWGKQFGMTVESFAGLPAVNGAIVNGGRLAVISDWKVPEKFRTIGNPANTDYYNSNIKFTKEYSGKYDAYIYISDKLLSKLEKPSIMLRPKTLVAGMGMRRGVVHELVLCTLEEAFLAAGLAAGSLKCLTSIDAKNDEEGLLKTAESLKIPCIFFTKDKLKEVVAKNNLATSTFVNRQMGVGAVCEPAALAVMEKSKLVLPKYVAQGVTIAIARIPFSW